MDNKAIEIPFGAEDSELKGWEYTIPEGMEAEIKDGKVIVKEMKSEDERIRKELVNFILYKTGYLLDEDTEHRFIAYLEKQKEPSMSAEGVLIRAGLKPYKDGNQWCILAGDNIQEGICGFGDTIDEALYQFLMEVLEMQKEQKPLSAEETELNSVAFLTEMGYTCIPPSKDGVIEKKIDALMKEQKPVNGDSEILNNKWSEQDEHIKKQVLNILEYCCTHAPYGGFMLSKKGYNEYSKWLQALKDRINPLPKQEWTDEDERIRKWIKNELAKRYVEDGIVNSIDADKAFAWLEKHKEKPSGEEMILLLRTEYEKGVADTIAKYEQKEQKPIQDETEREYVRTLKSLISDFLRGKEEVERGYYQQIYDWLDGRHIEQKPIQSIEDEDFVRTIKKLDPNVVVETFTTGAGELDGKAFLYTADKSYQIGFRDGFRNGVESVKPVEYLPEQKVFDIMTKLTNLSYSQLIPINSDEYKKIHEITCDVRSFLDYPIKPVEWSEEDDIMLNDIIRCLPSRSSAEFNIKRINWLKALRPQSKEELAKMLQDEYNKGKEIGEKEGYTKGYDKGYKDANESVSYHFPVMPTTPSVFGCDGTHCTNPHMDCINCPRKLTGGMFNTASSSGDPTLKAEWKPSEEQMDSLRDTIVETKGCEYSMYLPELYEDLKKL